jgi:hypothetical protein
MERLPTAPSFVGVDVSKDRLDVHIRPSGQTVAAQRNEAGVEQLVGELRQLAPTLIVLEATGGFETTVAAALPAPIFRSPSSIHGRSGTSPVPPGGSPKPTHSMPRSLPCLPNASDRTRSLMPMARLWRSWWLGAAKWWR